MPPQLILDSNYLAHMAKHSIKDLSWDGQQVGVIFGFLRRLLDLAKTFKTRHFIFVWDSKYYLRRELFPDYKIKRLAISKTEEERALDAVAYKQFDQLKNEVLPELGFKNNFEQYGYEGDDLIAIIVKSYPEESFTIISADEDLYQLLSDNVVIYSLKKKQAYTKHNLWKDFRIVPKEWAEVKSIAGCSSDEVPGIPGVKNVTASKFVARKLATNTSAYKAIRESTDIITKNRPLVTLPFKGVKAVEFIYNEKLPLKNFKSMCNKFGFRSFLDENQLKQWKQEIFYD